MVILSGWVAVCLVAADRQSFGSANQSAFLPLTNGMTLEWLEIDPKNMAVCHSFPFTAEAFLGMRRPP